MIVLLDTDVLIDIALNREPHFDDSAKILDLIESGFPKAFIAWHSIANFYYITEEQSKKKNSVQFIRELLQFINVAPTATKDAILQRIYLFLILKMLCRLPQQKRAMLNI